MNFARGIIMKCRHCNNWKCRCEDCICLVDKNLKWFCDNYDDYCENVISCYNYDNDTSCYKEGE